MKAYPIFHELFAHIALKSLFVIWRMGWGRGGWPLVDRGGRIGTADDAHLPEKFMLKFLNENLNMFWISYVFALYKPNTNRNVSNALFTHLALLVQFLRPVPNEFRINCSVDLGHVVFHLILPVVFDITAFMLTEESEYLKMAHVSQKRKISNSPEDL